MDASDSEAENYVVIQDSSVKSKLARKKRGKIQGKPLVSVDSSDSEGDNEKVQKFDIVHDFPVNEQHNEYVVDEVDSRKHKKVMAHYLWSKEEDMLLSELVAKMERWTDIAKLIPDRSARQCRLRWSRLQLCSNNHIKSGPWEEEEDNLLKDLVARHGFKWAEIAAEMQFRTAEQIRGRYTISLTPDRVNGSWTREEHRILLDSHQALGNKWVDIGKQLTGRVSKQIGSHFFEAVVPRMTLYLESLGKTSYSELLEEEIEQLITYLQVKRSSSVVSIHKKMGREPKRNAVYDETRPGHTKKQRRTKAQMLAAAAAAGGEVTSKKRPRVEGAAEGAEGELGGMDSIEALDVSTARRGDDSDSSDDEGGAPRPEGEDPLARKAARQIERQLERERDRQDEEDEHSGRKKVIWNEQEDMILRDMVSRRKPWTAISRAMNGSKSARQCRVRQTVFMNPEIKQGMWTEEEDNQLLQHMETFGHQWTDIALAMKNRTAEQVRGRYNNNTRAKAAARDALKIRPAGSSSSSSSSTAQFGQAHPTLQGGQYIHQLHLQQQQHMQQQHASLQVQQHLNGQQQGAAPVHYESDLAMMGELAGLDTV